MSEFNNAPGTNDIEKYAVSLSIEKAKKMCGRMKFIAIMLIVSGALQCLSIFSIPVGIFLILAGTKLLNAGNDIKTILNKPNSFSGQSAGENITEFVKKYSIGLIINIAISLVAILIYVLIIVVAIQVAPLVQ